MPAWIFQGNPDRFDVDEYLSKGNNIFWSVTKLAYQKLIKKGDPVFIWRAKGKKNAIPGIIAYGDINKECITKNKINPRLLSDNLWKGENKDTSSIKAGVKLLDVRLNPTDGMIDIGKCYIDPVLSNLHIMKVRTGSNFRLTNEQYLSLKQLWDCPKQQIDELYYKSYSAEEGIIYYELHMRRERNRKIIDLAKETFLKKYGQFFCEICGFSFVKKYGKLGEGFIEAHHKKPIHQIKQGYKTKIADIILVCSNCHRMLHKESYVDNWKILKNVIK